MSKLSLYSLLNAASERDDLKVVQTAFTFKVLQLESNPTTAGY